MYVCVVCTAWVCVCVLFVLKCVCSVVLNQNVYSHCIKNVTKFVYVCVCIQTRV